MRAVILVLVSLAAVVAAGPTMKMYEKSNDKIYKRVLVPVSSTVIPLEDLPVLKVGAGVGVGSSITIDEKLRPDGPVKLVTIHTLDKSKKKKAENGKDSTSAALIEELTEEEYKTLTQQKQE
ncbi:uncharacterized protein LOC135114669 [Scylla paramamosain]